MPDNANRLPYNYDLQGTPLAVQSDNYSASTHATGCGEEFFPGYEPYVYPEQNGATHAPASHIGETAPIPEVE